jgi:cell division protein FtsL
MFLRVAAKGGAVDDFPATGGILLIVLVRSVVISRAHAIIVMHRARSLLVQPTA